jgi:hypothetical protein
MHGPIPPQDGQTEILHKELNRASLIISYLKIISARISPGVDSAHARISLVVMKPSERGVVRREPLQYMQRWSRTP